MERKRVMTMKKKVRQLVVGSLIATMTFSNTSYIPYMQQTFMVTQAAENAVSVNVGESTILTLSNAANATDVVWSIEEDDKIYCQWDDTNETAIARTLKITSHKRDNGHNNNGRIIITATYKVGGKSMEDTWNIQTVSGLKAEMVSVQLSSISTAGTMNADGNISMKNNQTIVLQAIQTPSDADEAVTWTSSDSTVVSIDSTSGRAEANKVGTAVITATTASGTTGTVKISVVEKYTDKDFEYELNEDGTARLVKFVGETTSMGEGGIENYIKDRIDIPEEVGGHKVKTIGIAACYSQAGIKEVYIPEGIEEIEEGAFANCSSLESIFIPSSVKTIASRVLVDGNMQNLKNVVIYSPAGSYALEYASQNGFENNVKTAEWFNNQPQLNMTDTEVYIGGRDAVQLQVNNTYGETVYWSIAQSTSNGNARGAATLSATQGDTITVTGTEVGYVTVTAICGEKEMSCKLTVKQVENKATITLTDEKGVAFTNDTITIEQKGKLTIQTKVEENGVALAEQKINWRSSDEKVATVADGVVTAVGVGTAVVTATLDGNGNAAAVTVVVKNADGTTFNTGNTSNEKTGELFHLTDADFTKRVLNEKDLLVICEFSRDGCHPCELLEPFLETLAEEYKDKVVVTTINCSYYPKIGANYCIDQYPTVMYFVNGGEKFGSFVGFSDTNTRKEEIRQQIDKKVADWEVLKQSRDNNTQASEPAHGETGEGSGTEQPVPILDITGKNEVIKGMKVALKANVNGVTDAGKVSWKVSDVSIATVSKNGVVKGKKAGTVVVTASYMGIEKDFTITVKAPTIKLTGAKKVKKGKKITLKATVKNKVSGVKLKWKTSNKKYATVTQKGVVKGVRDGKSVKITATYGNVKKTIKVKVVK